MQARGARQHKNHVEGVRQRLSPRQCLGAPLPGLVGIAQRPQGLGAKDAAPHPGVIPKAEHVGPVLYGIIQRHALLRVSVGTAELAQEHHGFREHVVRPHDESHVVELFGEAEECFPQLVRHP